MGDAADPLERAVNAIRGEIHASRKYANELVRLNCAPDLLALKVFPDYKEVTESFAAVGAIRKHLAFDVDDPEVTALVVGDGSTPRTGATIAFRTKWNVISVDPALNMAKPSCQPGAVRRLTVEPKQVESLKPIPCKKAVVVAVHSHAHLIEGVRKVWDGGAEQIGVVAIPCCVKQELTPSVGSSPLAVPPDHTYYDYGIASPRREVLVWHDVRKSFGKWR